MSKTIISYEYYWPTIITEDIQLFNFMTTMEHISHNIETHITLLPSLSKVFSMFKMRMCYDNEKSG